MKTMRTLSLLCGVCMALVGVHRAQQTDAEDVGFTGSGKCRMCHRKEYSLWSASKHARLKTENADGEGMKFRKTTGFDSLTGRFAENGVGCEACHGPGSAHLRATGGTRKTTIVNGAKLKSPRGAMICGQCHSTGKSKTGRDFPEGFRAGGDLNAIFTVEQVTPHTVLSVYTEWAPSRHAEKGVGCHKCHEPHGTSGTPHQLKASDLELCGDCHTKQKDIKAHQPNAPAAATSCRFCHMPGGSHKFTEEGAREGMAGVK